MKHMLLNIVFVLVLWNGCLAAEDAISLTQVQAAFDKPIPAHPRLFLNDDQCGQLVKRIEQNPRMQTYQGLLIKKADRICGQKPLKRVLEGRRLLGVSIRCLDRVFTLSMVYRLTGKDQYLQRAEEEMLAAAAFEDWNPDHFLDVAEMTAGLAIGYDWLYSDLSEASREAILQAILQKGIAPSLDTQYNGFLRATNNWNQVCNGGITLGALAIYEQNPQQVQQLVHRAVNSVPLAMHKYEPDGAYPEGPGYWTYGTSYNVILIEALDSVLGTDFGLSDLPAFRKSADYMLHVAGPTGLYFNYPDSRLNKSFSPALFWFAQRYNRPSLVWHDFQLWQRLNEKQLDHLVSERLASLVLCWFVDNPPAPKQQCWMGQGINSVAMFRSSWTDPDATYLAIKGGTAGASHGHMDVGSFVLEAEGVRWAVDLGSENYHKIESLGMQLWGRSQDAQRWTIFRYNNLSHNTLVVDGQHQRVTGHAPIIRYSEDPSHPHVAFDMSSVYKNQLKRAVRGAALLPSGKILIQDDIEALDKPVTVRWAMATPAKVTLKSKLQAVLQKDGKQLTFHAMSDSPVQLEIYSTDPKAAWDAPNPDTRMIGFEVELAAGQKKSLAVVMTPGGKPGSGMLVQPVESWSAPLEKTGSGQ